MRRDTAAPHYKLAPGLDWARLGSVLGLSRAILGHLGHVLGLPWVVLALSWAILAETGFVYERSEGLTDLSDSKSRQSERKCCLDPAFRPVRHPNG